MDDQNVSGVGFDAQTEQIKVEYPEIFSFFQAVQQAAQDKDLERVEELIEDLTSVANRIPEALYLQVFYRFLLDMMKTCVAHDATWKQHQEYWGKRQTNLDEMLIVVGAELSTAKQLAEIQTADHAALKQKNRAVKMELAVKSEQNQMLLGEIKKLRAEFDVLQQKEIVARLNLDEKTEENQMLAARVAKLKAEVIALRKLPK